MKSLKEQNEQTRRVKRTVASGKCSVSSGECYSLEWRMNPLGSIMNSLEWQNEQLQVVK